MKPFALLIAFLACSFSARADMLGINIELSHDNGGHTLVSLRAGYLTQYNRDKVSVKTAAKILTNLKFDLDAKFAVIHSKESIALTDLMPLFQAMTDNHIGLSYMQIGTSPPTGMDIWNHK